MKVELFIEEIKAITELGVAEIVKRHTYSYFFRVGSMWYSVYYENDYGYFLTCSKGNESDQIDTPLFVSEQLIGKQSPLRKIGDSLFEYLERIYLSQRVFKNDLIVNSLQHYIIIIEQCTGIEKLSNNIFTVKINSVEYLFEKKSLYDFDCKILLFSLEISSKDKREYLIEEPNTIDAIISILNSIFYISKSSKIEIDTKKLLEIFNIKQLT